MLKLLVRVLPLMLLTVVIQARSQDSAQPTDAGKKALARINQLGGLAMALAQNDRRMEVSYPQIDGKFTDEHLALLKDLKDVVHLNLRGQPVTDTHLIQLKGLTTLTRLHLEKTKITDKGLEPLKDLVNLEYLNLYGTEVTDAGLVHLEGMKKLKNLYLWQTKVTDAGTAKLKMALPQADINRGFDTEKPAEDKKDKKDKSPKGDDKKPKR